MAKLQINGIEHEILDNSSISDLCRQSGIPFNCNTGVCGSCQIHIIDGLENLNDLTEEEIDFGLDESNRLACMCFIKTGLVKISF